MAYGLKACSCDPLRFEILHSNARMMSEDCKICRRNDARWQCFEAYNKFKAGPTWTCGGAVEEKHI